MKIRTTFAKYTALFALAFAIGLCFAPQGQADLCAPQACFIVFDPDINGGCPAGSPCEGEWCRKWFTERIPNGACCADEIYFDHYQCN